MKVYLSTLGCKLNESELEAWARKFGDDGYQIVDDPQSRRSRRAEHVHRYARRRAQIAADGAATRARESQRAIGAHRLLRQHRAG